MLLQWVDFHIPGVDVIGGYSITSVPSQLPLLELAVKASPHPPAAWVTEQAAVGDRVQLQVGGEFVYRPPATPTGDGGGGGPLRLLFIAGGVGINPLYGMLREIGGDNSSKAVLLYSASVRSELVFEPELTAMAAAAPDSFKVLYTATKEEQVKTDQTRLGRMLDQIAPAAPPGGHGVRDQAGRISNGLVGKVCGWLGGVPDAVYVCGPPGMAEDMVEVCARHGISKDRVNYEQWW